MSWLIWYTALLTKMSSPPSSSTAVWIISPAVLRVHKVAFHQDCTSTGLLDIACSVLGVGVSLR